MALAVLGDHWAPSERIFPTLGVRDVPGSAAPSERAFPTLTIPRFYLLIFLERFRCRKKQNPKREACSCCCSSLSTAPFPAGWALLFVDISHFSWLSPGPAVANKSLSARTAWNLCWEQLEEKLLTLIPRTRRVLGKSRSSQTLQHLPPPSAPHIPPKHLPLTKVNPTNLTLPLKLAKCKKWLSHF